MASFCSVETHTGAEKEAPSTQSRGELSAPGTSGGTVGKNWSNWISIPFAAAAANGERQRITGQILSGVLAGLPPTHAETKMLTTNSIVAAKTEFTNSVYM